MSRSASSSTDRSHRAYAPVGVSVGHDDSHAAIDINDDAASGGDDSSDDRQQLVKKHHQHISSVAGFVRRDTVDGARDGGGGGDDDEEDDDDQAILSESWSGWRREFTAITRRGWVLCLNQLLQFLPGIFAVSFLSTPDELAGASSGFFFANIIGVSLVVGFGTGT